MAITLRAVKGSPLSHTEMDNNFKETQFEQRATVDSVIATGTADALIADFTNDVVLAEGITVVVEAAAVNTGAATINVDALGVKDIKKENQQALIAGDIIGANHYLILRYDNTAGNWVLLNPGIASKVVDADTLDGVQGASFARSDAADTISGIHTHTVIPVFNGGSSGSTAPFTVDSTFLVTNLNADLLDGNEATAFLGVGAKAADSELLDGVNGASYARSDTADAISGIHTHSVRPAFNGGTSGVSSPFTVDSTFVVTNLNADLLDGNSSSAFLGVSAKAADSELLDGINSTSFLRSDAADTKTSGNLVINDNVQVTFGTGSDVDFYFSGSDMFTDIVSTTGVDWFIRDGTTSRFLFDKDEGDFHADGDIIAFSSSVGSDPRLKDNIQPIENALEKIEQLTGVTFSWKKNDKSCAGLLSTEVKRVLPEAVNEVKHLGEEHGNMYEHVNYNAVIGMLVQAINELNEKVETLQKG